MILLSLLMFPAMVIRYNMGLYEMMIVDVPLFLGATMSVCSFYLMSQREVFGDTWRSRIKYLPAVLAVGIGLSVNNAKAVLEALFGMQSEFTRTPKYRVEGAGDEWKQKRYRGSVDARALRRAAAGRLLHRHGLVRGRRTGSSARCPSSCCSSSASCTRPSSRSSRTSASWASFRSRKPKAQPPGPLRTSEPSGRARCGARSGACSRLHAAAERPGQRRQDRRRQALRQPVDGGRRLPQPDRRPEQRRRPGRRLVRLQAARRGPSLRPPQVRDRGHALHRAGPAGRRLSRGRAGVRRSVASTAQPRTSARSTGS